MVDVIYIMSSLRTERLNVLRMRYRLSYLRGGHGADLNRFAIQYQTERIKHQHTQKMVILSYLQKM